ncbi:ParB/RepB/Spo0J family partition protein [Pectinatus brassicae]|uniref:ParB family chromosome partitioning protein n=1 Tax=Pectinatus brassicae TaxID=862415 RepID=A0A840UNT0_9FIRM|nr:ParB N-terminal domain-containing protein [Pectinatus brassicae]MBB5337567.1 ParB family chromosome partitioning protein [Pectinatus brassicae]
MGFSMIAALGEKNDNKVPEIKMININDLASDIQNFYRVSGDEDIEKKNELLFADVLERGIESPIIVKQLDNGKFQIISGHRRREICYRLVSEGHDKFQFIPAIISQVNSENPNEINEVKNEINLIMSNVTSRELNDWEKVQQITRLDALYKQLKASGEKTSGRIDELIAEKLNISKSAVGRAKNINKNLSDDYKKELEKGKLSISAANKLASKPKEEQEKLHEKNPAPKASELEKPQSLLPTTPEPPRIGEQINTNEKKQEILSYKKIPSYDGYVGGVEKENISFNIGYNEDTKSLFAYILVDDNNYMIDLNMICHYVKECIQSGVKL